MSNHQHVADPFDLPPRFIDQRIKSSRHRIGPGVEAMAMERLCDEAELELERERMFAADEARNDPAEHDANGVG